MLLTKTCLGIDLSGKDIRIVELRKTRGKYQVVQAARVKVGGDVGATLSSFFRETQTRPSKIAFSLPTNACAVKFAELPKTKPAETARMARYEAETQLPLLLSDLQWGYSAARPARGEDLSHVVIAGARRTIVEDTVSLLESAEMVPHAAMVAALAETRCLRAILRPREEPVLLVNIGDEWTDISTVLKGRVTACRCIHLGTSDLAECAAKDLGIGLLDALKLIADRTVLHRVAAFDGRLDKVAVEQWFEKLSAEVRRSALASQSGGQLLPVSAALLLGDGAAIPRLADMLASAANLSIEVGDPWSGMSLNATVTHNQHDAPTEFAVATGLAMAALDGHGFINLMPRERAEEASKRRRGIAGAAALGIVAIVMLASLVCGESDVTAKMAELDALGMRVKAARAQATYVPPLLRTATPTMDKVLKEIKNKKNSPIEIMLQLSQGLPRSCWLSEFRFDSGKSVVLRGNALSSSCVADAVYMLSNAGVFDSVSLDYSNLSRADQSPVYDFQIKCVLPANKSIAALSKRSDSAKERLVVR